MKLRRRHSAVSYRRSACMKHQWQLSPVVNWHPLSMASVHSYFISVWISYLLFSSEYEMSSIWYGRKCGKLMHNTGQTDIRLSWSSLLKKCVHVMNCYSEMIGHVSLKLEKLVFICSGTRILTLSVSCSCPGSVSNVDLRLSATPTSVSAIIYLNNYGVIPNPLTPEHTV
jgi:hypothetical protein